MATEIRRLFAVYGMLILLLSTTVACAILLPPSTVKPFISIAIAFAKAALIYWFFMRLRAEPGLVRLFAVAGLLWVFVLFFLGLPVD
jgi:cytochrome c oxidase subunit IV